MKILSFDPANGINGKSHRREKHFTTETSIIKVTDLLTPSGNLMAQKEFKVPVTIRAYRTANKVSFCIWIFDEKAIERYAINKTHDAINGSGISNSREPAMHQALASCGFCIDEQRGYSYDQRIMEAAAEAIAYFLGYAKHTYYIHTAHA